MPTCIFCKIEHASLIDSHLIPAGFYRQMTKSHQGYTSATEKRATNTSQQVRQKLLCSECEEKFNKNGEDWILKNYWSGQKFPLLDEIAKLTPASKKANISHFFITPSTSKIDLQKMVYFAASVFWRASVSSWSFPAGKTIYGPLELGPYSEKLHTFLSGGMFPNNTSLGIFIAPYPKQDGIIFPQKANREDGGFIKYGFFIPGVSFILCVGKKIPDAIKNESASHNNVLMLSMAGENLAIGLRRGLASP